MILSPGTPARPGSGVRIYLDRGDNACSPSIAGVAFHEAGHAVVATVYRFIVQRASIIADLDSIEHVSFAGFNNEAHFASVPPDLWAVMYFAGRAAHDHAAYRYGLPIIPGSRPRT